MNRQQRRAAARSTVPAGAAGLFATAVAHHQAGRLGDAEAIYRRILSAQANHADAAFNLAIALRARGDVDGAVALYRGVLEARPDYPEAAYNLGNALMAKGAVSEAIAAYQRALQTKPGHTNAAGNLAIAAMQHGVAMLDAGLYNNAAQAFQLAIAHKPAAAEAHYNLGNALRALRRTAQAIESYRTALAHRPAMVQARANLGTALLDNGDADAALAAYAQALTLAPDKAELHYNRGNALKAKGALEDAAQAYVAALERDCSYTPALANLAIVRTAQGRIDEALTAYRAAIVLAPDDSVVALNYLLTLNYDEHVSREDVFTAHCTVAARLPMPMTFVAPDNAVPRIGFVSPDLRQHSVASFVEPLFAHRTRGAFDVICYADVFKPDDTTIRLRALSDDWVDATTLNDGALAAQIVADQIDILIDLAGYTSHNRLGVFARKPAPVQLSWLGYPNTTGLATMDYRLVDAVTDPEGAEAFASEELLRLPGGFLCYEPAGEAPPVARAPCLANGFVTFGSFNNPAKISDGTVAAWSAILRQVPDARLVLKGRGFGDAATAGQFRQRFAANGVDPARLGLSGWRSGAHDHLAHYSTMDIALDPFPYNGTTTTCEALWMGVPVITVVGDRHAARVGASLLKQAGLANFIAEDVEDYITLAARKAGDQQALISQRPNLRARMIESPLCDGRAFALAFEDMLTAIRSLRHPVS